MRLPGLFATILFAACPVNALPGLCKWVDEAGSVHYAESCPEGVETETVEIGTGTDAAIPETKPSVKVLEVPPAGLTGELVQEAGEHATFESLTSASQLRGCWRRIYPPAELNPNPNKIEIFPFEEPRHQYFCFASAGKLYTMMTTRKPAKSGAALEKLITVLPSVERYKVTRRGLVSIEHLDARSMLHWVTSVARLTGAEEVLGFRSGDVLMTLRHAETGEDLYLRHLRRID